MGEQERLETAIANSPDDVDAYLVYGDWLQQHGDPRGDLIALQHRHRDDAANELLVRHADYFYGALARRPGLVQTTWRFGFIRACRFSLDDDRGTGHEQRALAALEQLLALPSARFLRELSLGVMNVPYNSYRAALEVIGRHDMRSLDRLAIGDGVVHGTKSSTDVFTTEIGPDPLPYASFPNVKTLIVRATGDEANLAGIALPKLTELRATGEGGGQWLSEFLRADLPELGTLELTGSFAVEDATWDPLLNGHCFPKLRHLGFGVSSFLIGRAGALIANAPVLQQLHSLDLSKTMMTESDVASMLARPSAFAHLELLRFGLVRATPDLLSALRGLCVRVEVPFSYSPDGGGT